MSGQVELDPVDFSVISQALVAIAAEMDAKMVRAAYSSIVREGRDASAAVLDRDGNTVAQAESHPMHLATLSLTLGACIARCPIADLGEGDFYINNHPYHGGQHLPDIYIFVPVWVDGEVLAFTSTVAHHVDFGGGSPGLNVNARDLYSEGLIIAPMRCNLERDWNGGLLETMVTANVRVPQQTIGDFNAQFSACGIGAERIRELCRRYGKLVVLAVMREVLDYSERRARAALARAPDGVYHGEAFMDPDPDEPDAEPGVIRAKITIAGDSVEVDFDGSMAQVKRAINCPFASTVAATASCLKSVLTPPDVPFNEGILRPVTIKAPLGTIMNPRYPAPVRGRMEPCYRAYNALMQALAQAVPDHAIADGYDTTTAVSINHLGEHGFKVYLEIFHGGFGASKASDGADGISGPLSNSHNQPIESLDLGYGHFRVAAYGLHEGSGGDGEHRGGLGFMRKYEILEDNVIFSLYADRFALSNRGAFGGQPGGRARCEIHRGNEVIQVSCKHSTTLRKGDLLCLYTGGGGGYGTPAARSAAARERDRAEGYVDR